MSRQAAPRMRAAPSKRRRSNVPVVQPHLVWLLPLRVLLPLLVLRLRPRRLLAVSAVRLAWGARPRGRAPPVRREQCNELATRHPALARAVDLHLPGRPDSDRAAPRRARHAARRRAGREPLVYRGDD